MPRAATSNQPSRAGMHHRRATGFRWAATGSFGAVEQALLSRQPSLGSGPGSWTALGLVEAPALGALAYLLCYSRNA